MNLFHRFEGAHVEGCFTENEPYPRESVWSFGGEHSLSFRRKNGHRAASRESTHTFLVGRCNNPNCTALVYVRASDISSYVEAMPS